MFIHISFTDRSPRALSHACWSCRFGWRGCEQGAKVLYGANRLSSGLGDSTACPVSIPPVRFIVAWERAEASTRLCIGPFALPSPLRETLGTHDHG